MSQARGSNVTTDQPIPLLPLRAGALFPGTVLNLPVGRERSVALFEAIGTHTLIGVVAQRDGSVSDPTERDLHPVGTLARVQRIERARGGVLQVQLEGVSRFELVRLVQSEPYWRAEVKSLREEGAERDDARVVAKALKTHFDELAQATSRLTPIGADEDEPGRVADQVAAQLQLSTEKEVAVLGQLDVMARLRLVTELLAEAKALVELKRKIDADVRRELNDSQKQALLREQMKAMRRELGDDKSEDELAKLRARLEAAQLPDEVRTTIERELRRFESLQPQQPEYNVLRNYLELVADLPWSVRAAARDDLEAVAKKLDEDHAGLGDIKRRLLEHMAVLKLSGNPRGTILCFAGPPGVGKTSLGQSIADATGRPFLRIALGGVRDEAEIRGHRRTYVGALPGRVIAAFRKAKVKNPVVLLDEIDKLSEGGWSGSPEAALLEVLDPEQNKTFTDHYLELPFDLSEAMFICTANDLDRLSRPLRDRLEIVELSGYTTEEKLEIARRHLLPRAMREAGVPATALDVSDDALRAVIRDYTREAGVRGLTRELAKIARRVALTVARTSATHDGATRADGPSDGASGGPRVRIDASDVSEYLGKTRFFAEVAERTSVPGVATGLAWTPVGGDILFIETTRMVGKGRVEITGQLGDVMKESARAALSYVRANANLLGIDPQFLETHDVHIHVPAGAVPKDGPSAGVTLFTALTSLFSSRRVRPDTAMTGECTLRGRVMPVGGIKSKVLAAHRAGIRRVILPAHNARDLDEVPREVRAQMEFVFADEMAQVLAAALEEAPAVATPTVREGESISIAA